MIKLEDINNDDYLIIEPKDYYDSFVMDKEEFMQSHWYLDKEDIKVFTVKEEYACFDLECALECMEDDMHEDWLSNVLNSIPEEVKGRIENEVNEYLKKEPTYYPNVEVDWR